MPAEMMKSAPPPRETPCTNCWPPAFGLVGSVAEALPSQEAPYYGIEHIGLTVDDIDATAKDLDAKGVTFVQRPSDTATGNRNAFVRGPEGVLIEIIQLG